MNILVTGATGLIGKALINTLTPEHTVIALSRSLSKVAVTLPSTVQGIDSLESVDFNTLDVVINLAGEPIADKRWSKQQKQRILDSRIHTTTNLAAKISAATTPPHTFISGSAIGFYGRQDSQAIAEDFTHCYDEFSHELCQQWEQLALKVASDKTRVCVLRTGIVLCKSGGALAKMLPPFRFGLGGKMASGEQMMSWIHIEDMVRLILFIVSRPTLTGAINATAPNAVSNLDFSRQLAQTLSRPCLFPMPEFVLKLLFGEMADLLIYGQNVIPTKLINSGFEFRYPALQPALTQLLKN